MKSGIVFSSRRLAGVLALPILACVPAACSSNSGGDTGAAADVPAGVTVLSAERASLVPTFVRGNLHGAKVTSESAVRAALPTVAAVLHGDGDFDLTNVQTDESGGTHYRYAQKKNGLEVLGGDIAVHVKDGAIYAANGNVRSDLPAPTAATVPAKVAAAKALAGYGANAQVAADAASDLAYWRAPEGDALKLVHRVTVRGVDEDGDLVDTVLVDAQDGSIVDRIPTIMTVKTRKIYDAAQSTSQGTLKRSEGQAEVSDGAVNVSYDNLGVVYDAYKALYNRDSLDGRGLTLISSVHAVFCTDIFCFGKTKNNASWDGKQMRYGDGDGSTFTNLAYSLDVTGHELTHGVTSSTSNLTYSGQSGGLNEGWSDIFGAVVQWYNDGKVVKDSTWLVGDDVYTPNKAGDALRYMNNPTKDGKSIDYAPDYNNQNVHYTSGVPNLAFYLLSQGGTHPRGKTTVNVTGIGMEKAAAVFYRANTTIFTSSTNYAQARTGTEQAAQQLELTADEIKSVSNAWAAVGVGSAVQ
ncbi:M4 family metallopeptidase [Pendulispora brunnea]|uniref:Neutral metalloproteinase n=1 Tax=Pendulispora brunnea TaxID=2905690 RepID=A0ABZ2K5P9_9BACT